MMTELNVGKYQDRKIVQKHEADAKETRLQRDRGILQDSGSAAAKAQHYPWSCCGKNLSVVEEGTSLDWMLSELTVLAAHHSNKSPEEM